MMPAKEMTNTKKYNICQDYYIFPCAVVKHHTVTPSLTQIRQYNVKENRQWSTDVKGKQPREFMRINVGNVFVLDNFCTWEGFLIK